MEQTIELLADSVRNMDEDLVVTAANQVVEKNIDPLIAINDGLIKGMNQAGELFEKEEYFVPELLMCSDVMNTGLKIITPQISSQLTNKKVKVVIGVVQGDTHDIGKNLVNLMLDTGGYDVIDLGRNVPASKFAETIIKENAKVLCLSTLMSTTMSEMSKVIELLKEKSIREDVIVMVGGGPVSPAFAEKIGADGYSSNANSAVKLVNRLAEERGYLI